MSIERCAEETRIRADFLMRMESDEFDFLAPAYVRGFLKSYAYFLRVKPEPLPLLYIVLVLGSTLMLDLLPYLEELWRGVRARSALSRSSFHGR